ncbi:MAG: efflux RND transporter periplasmic adaptor subunit [Pseudomonadaceae bacterium]|nr:efflux RND transporter periplasmic adaptor subunit [Pseudomonadaceae bacterium]
MNRVSTWLANTALVAIIVGCEPPPPPEPVPQNIRPARIHIVTPTESGKTYRFAGEVQATTSIDASFEVGGALDKLSVREGQTVSAGSTIAQLDPTNFLLAIREAEAQLKLVRQDYIRKRDILGRGGIARSAVDDAGAQVELARVRLAQAQKQYRDSRLLAPFDAQISQRFVDNYSKVQPGEPIVRLSGLSELVIAAAVPEALLATLDAQAVESIEATFAFAPDRRFPLTFRENRGEADPMAQTFEITLTMAQPKDLNILPGMTAEVRLSVNGKAQDSQFSIPTSALVSAADGRFFVWVVPPDGGPVEQRFVDARTPTAEGALIADGLQPGEAIVSSGAAYLQKGMQVRPLERI